MQLRRKVLTTLTSIKLYSYFSGIDVQAALQKIGVSPTVSDSSVATEASTFVVAYACHKVFAPLNNSSLPVPAKTTSFSLDVV